MNRFILQHSATQSDGWVVTDTKYNIVIRFTDGQFNETQQVTDLDGMPPEDYMILAHSLSEIGDWMVRYHSSKCFSQPYGIEYNEETEQPVLYRRKYPRWRLVMEDDVNAKQLAGTLRKAAEFLTKQTKTWQE